MRIGSVDGATDGPAVDPEEELGAGTMVGDYEIEKLIGWGGMGIVYGAIHPVIGKRAAIKVLNAKYCADRETVARFMREAQAVNQIAHGNIVDIFAIGQLEDGRSYLVMEWLQGETLMDRLEKQPLSIAETIAILVALTRALEAAHNAGVIHRDLKPENIFLIPDDESFRVKLLDFGIAKLDTGRAPTRKTATGMTVGTPLFMSPEQAKGTHIDGRTDIYSLGVLAYAMLCRRTPFEHEGSPIEVLHAHISKPPEPPRELVASLPPALDTLILQMLAKAPDERPSLAEVRRRLKSIDGGGFETFTSETPLPSRPAPIAGTLEVPARRRSPLPIILGLAAIAGAVAVFFAVRGDDETTSPPAAMPVVEQAPPSQPAPAPAEPTMGTVQLEVEPATAKITIGDQPIALQNGRASVALAPGDHSIASSASGYKPSETPVAVTSGVVTPVTIKLTKQSATRPKSSKKKPKDVDAVVDPFKRKKR